MAETIRIEGLAELRRKLRRLGDEAIEDGKDMNAKAAKIVERRAETTVPFRSGKLKNTVRSSGTRATGKIRAGGLGVRYAGPIHFGWPNRPYGDWVAGVARGGPIRPQPFLYDAMDDRRRQVIDSYERDVSRLVRKYNL